jgi:hypothetical protein
MMTIVSFPISEATWSFFSLKAENYLLMYEFSAASDAAP